MRAARDVPLAPLTTLRLGGPARRFAEARTEDELVSAVRQADEAGEPLLLLAGGSNLVLADAGWDGTVVAVRTRGTEGDGGRLVVAAGEDWDPFVARCIGQGLAGIECLSGIPGSVGATPIQNVGAYGQEVSETVARVRAYDRRAGEVVELSPADCGFGYRTSAFKGADRHVVLSVTFALAPGELSQPIRYAELARTLGVETGERAPLADVRRAVLELRRGKGMVLDPCDADTVSAGSFFMNPVLGTDGFAALRQQVARRLGEGVAPPGFPDGDGHVKTSAAWLIERAGFERGYGHGGARVSSKHTLALTNRGGTTAELVALAREIRDGVRDAFGIELHAEPTLVGVSL
jgi:UDP-N-acetylmuramate dehydrogenase